MRCLTRFSQPGQLAEHVPRCQGQPLQRVVMPTEANKWMQFSQLYMCNRRPIVIYADFECLQERAWEGTEEPEVGVLTRHRPFHVMLAVVSDVRLPHLPPWLVNFALGEGREARYVSVGMRNGQTDAHVWFVRRLKELEGYLAGVLDAERGMVPLTPEEMTRHAQAAECRFCGRPFGDGAWGKVHDHSHVTGLYRGAAHASCNLRAGQQERPGTWGRAGTFVPVVFHNLKGYDGHLIVQALATERVQNLHVLPENMERFKSVSFGLYRLIDSNQLMPGTLEGHLAALPEEERSILHRCFHRPEWKVVLKRKGVMPYDWYDSPEKYHHSRLPAKPLWYNRLTGCGPSDDDFVHVVAVWRALGCRSFGHYLAVYMAVDVLGLADVVESFRRQMMSAVGLDPVYSVSAASLSWQAMLRTTGCKLELLTANPRAAASPRARAATGGPRKVSARVAANLKARDTLANQGGSKRRYRREPQGPRRDRRKGQPPRRREPQGSRRAQRPQGFPAARRRERSGPRLAQ